VYIYISYYNLHLLHIINYYYNLRLTDYYMITVVHMIINPGLGVLTLVLLLHWLQKIQTQIKQK